MKTDGKEITLILAHGDDGVIGNHGKLPWPVHKEDMRRFREATRGSTLIMGRKTYDSLSGPLPWRQNVVISRTPEIVKGNVVAVRDFAGAVAAAGDTQVFVIGGADVFAMAMPTATRILVTEMHGNFPGDIYFKIPFLHQWTEISREKWTGDGVPCDFVEYRLL